MFQIFTSPGGCAVFDPLAEASLLPSGLKATLQTHSTWPRRLKTCCPVAASQTRTSVRSEEHTSELQSHLNLVCRLLLEKKNIHKPHYSDLYPRSLCLGL